MVPLSDPLEMTHDVAIRGEVPGTHASNGASWVIHSNLGFSLGGQFFLLLLPGKIADVVLDLT